VIVGDTGVFRVDTYPFGGVKGSGLGSRGRALGDGSMTEARMLVLTCAAALTRRRYGGQNSGPEPRLECQKASTSTAEDVVR